MKVVIIGAGLAGITLANALKQYGITVTVLEKGTQTPAFPSDIDFSERTFGLDKFEASAIGGTTTLWHGSLMPLSAREFGSTDSFQKLRPALSAHYTQISQREFGGLNPFSSDGNVLHALAANLSEVTVAVPYKPRTALPSPGLALYSGITDLEFDIIDHRIRSVRYTQAGVSSTLCADIFVICGGGLSSPGIVRQVLKAARLQNKNVGHWLIDHPMGYVGKVRVKKAFDTSGLIAAKFTPRYALRRGFAYYDATANLSHCLYLRPAFGLREHEDIYLRKRMLSGYRANRAYLKVLQNLFSPDVLMEAVATRIGSIPPTRTFSILIVTEQKAIYERSVREHSGRRNITWFLAPDEIDSAKRAVKTFLQHFKTSFEGVNFLPDALPNRLWSGAHYSGTCRISDSPENGVVSTSLKLYGLDNCYVCDGSVLPKTGYANTGITIMALSEWLAQRIAS